ncbi:hypothetical protein [Candidatus Kuenenia stuttgartiensis]|uniref:hypothetical protein n=1 Tax=Kuenenia stuttgartiensis TaxID=174633 RepID=UPI00146CFF76|nr:hypothetical protein [Candidatus Kuenenia stuttgartiensis]
MKHLLKRMLDESEFLSDYGVRALSRYHLEHLLSYILTEKYIFSVSYQPDESATQVLFGAIPNWRGSAFRFP